MLKALKRRSEAGSPLQLSLLLEDNAAIFLRVLWSPQ